MILNTANEKDEDNYIPPEWLIYSKSNSAILTVKNEIDVHLVQLKIAVKAGDFHDYFEREAPAIYEKLSEKREERRAGLFTSI